MKPPIPNVTSGEGHDTIKYEGMGLAVRQDKSHVISSSNFPSLDNKYKKAKSMSLSAVQGIYLFASLAFRRLR